MNKLNFEIYNKSDLFFKYKIKLEILMAIYGDNARVYDIIKRSNKDGNNID